MAEVDILMQEKQDDGSYNQLYPITKASNVNYTNSALSGVSNAQQGLDSIVNTLGDINLNNYFTKTQTLTQATAALFGLGTDAVPDDVLAVLGRFNSGLCNEYVWSKASTVWEPSLDTNNTSGTKYIYFSDKKKVLYSDQVIADSSGVTLKNPTTITVTLSNEGNLAGKYFRFSTDSATNVRVFNRSTNSADYVQYTETPVKSVSVQKIVGYVNSPDPDAYPPANHGEYTYTPLGQLGSKVRIATGSYVGTGKYGQSNPNSLTFEFPPDLIIIHSYVYGLDTDTPALSNLLSQSPCIVTDELTTSYRRGFSPCLNSSAYYGYAKKSSDGKTVSWYNTKSAGDQLNSGPSNNVDSVYHYIAFAK